MSRPRLLDLFCGAGGCAVGYHRAGFDVVGVDAKPQKNYPFPFAQGDALEYLARHGGEFDAIHASPPCQLFSAASRVLGDKKNRHLDLVDPCRQLLEASSRPWVMENVMGAPLRDATMLCGTMFKLRVLRHRLFECSFFLMAPGQRCWHPPRGTVGRANTNESRRKNVGDWISVAGDTTIRLAGPAMGIDWVTCRKQLSQCIPPAYTEFVGRQLIERVR